MPARITDISVRTWVVWVNAQEVKPDYHTEAKAISRASQEARTHHHVQVVLNVGGRPPRNVATWVDGVRQKG